MYKIKSMFNLKSFKNIGATLYLFIYLIFPYSAITQTTKINLRSSLEKSLNSRNLEVLKESFRDASSLEVLTRFANIINEFPDSKWKIKELNSNKPDEKLFQIKVFGKKVVDEEIYTLESTFNYFFSSLKGKISKGTIKKLFTIIRNDDKKIDITFKIPDKVLTGTKYDIDIILNEPLEEVIVAGGIINHQVKSFLEQEINLEPLVSGGIFKITRAPSQPGMQIWSGIIAHPHGIITFTKSIDVVKNL